MSGFGQVPLKDIWEMLDQCAPGHTRHETDHFYRICYGTQTFPNFPKKRQVDRGYVKKMARHLGVLDCAKNHLGIT